jgi:hypothetical protein
MSPLLDDLVFACLLVRLTIPPASHITRLRVTLAFLHGVNYAAFMPLKCLLQQVPDQAGCRSTAFTLSVELGSKTIMFNFVDPIWIVEGLSLPA